MMKARLLGADRIIATGRDPAKLDALRQSGADTVIALTNDEGAMQEAFSAAFSSGVDVVLDYLWGDSARAILLAAARTPSAERALRFVQIGSMSGLEIALPAAVLRSRAVTLMGSGIGSIALPRLLRAVGAVLEAAADGRLHIATEAVPLAALADHRNAPASEGRKVFVMP